MKKLLCLITTLCFIFTTTASAEGTSGRRSTLITTHDPLRYSVFTADGNTITAHGYYANDPVIMFEIVASLRDNSLEFRQNSDNTYTASFSGVTTDRFAYIRLTKKSGLVYNYRVEYQSGLGWYFADNGFDERHISLAENHTEMPLIVTVQYLVNVSGTEEDVAETLSQIKAITAQVTDGLDNNYDKARAITGWVAENIYYDTDARDMEVTLETIALNKVLYDRKTVCAGYANLTAAMLEAAGLKAITVIGTAVQLNEYENLPTEDRHHEWTAFWYEEEARWVFMDSGWDSRNLYEHSRYNKTTAPKRYFDITPFAFSQNHRAFRAEHRDYFNALDYFIPAEPEPPQSVGDDAHIVPPESTTATTTTIATTTTTTTAATTVITLPPQEPHDPPEPPPEPNNLPLYITIAALSLTAITITIVIIIRIRK
ncbi:MAG: transglutaminase domain-containing protein [Oscillospiraceae bacterium]|nr:transglutaminase domain-containing protein [Oscillospiraceae bacterium]